MKKGFVVTLLALFVVSGVFGTVSSLNGGDGVEDASLKLTLGIKGSTESGWFGSEENANTFSNPLSEEEGQSFSAPSGDNDSTITLYPAVKTNEAVKIQMTISGGPLTSESDSSHSIPISAQGADYSNGTAKNTSVSWSESNSSGTLTYEEDSVGTESRVVTKPVTFTLTKEAYNNAVAASDYVATVTLSVQPVTE